MPYSSAPEAKPFDLYQFYDGPTEAFGFVQSRDQKFQRQFNCRIVGDVQGEKLTLNEEFWFDDGGIDKRQWNVERTAPGQYRATSDDIKGYAIGKTEGNILTWKYNLYYEVFGARRLFSFDDWMIGVSDTEMINKSQMRKFGLRLADLVLTFRKL